MLLLQIPFRVKRRSQSVSCTSGTQFRNSPTPGGCLKPVVSAVWGTWQRTDICPAPCSSHPPPCRGHRVRAPCRVGSLGSRGRPGVWQSWPGDPTQPHVPVRLLLDGGRLATVPKALGDTSATDVLCQCSGRKLRCVVSPKKRGDGGLWGSVCHKKFKLF